MKVTFWKAEISRDHDVYSAVAPTRKGVIKKLKEWGYQEWRTADWLGVEDKYDSVTFWATVQWDGEKSVPCLGSYDNTYAPPKKFSIEYKNAFDLVLQLKFTEGGPDFLEGSAA